MSTPYAAWSRRPLVGRPRRWRTARCCWRDARSTDRDLAHRPTGRRRRQALLVHVEPDAGAFGRGAACWAPAPVETTVAAAAPMTVRRLIRSPSLRSLFIDPPGGSCAFETNPARRDILARCDEIDAAVLFPIPACGERTEPLCNAPNHIPVSSPGLSRRPRTLGHRAGIIEVAGPATTRERRQVTGFCSNSAPAIAFPEAR
jgi:hypothetical protein